MSRLFFIPFLAIALSALPHPSAADIYRYTDENGVIHFTNAPVGKGYTRVIREKASASTGDYEHIIASTSSKYNIEPAILKAVITAESNWDAKAISPKGAIGLMQLMPSTAEDMEVANPHDPEDNIEGGARYLRHLLNRFNGDLDLALAAYNAGPGRVEQSGGIPPIAETIKYVKNV
ncbi:MAG: lytic transglycosylase domain-containing protein, partial [Nitrospiraceae bacterium]